MKSIEMKVLGFENGKEAKPVPGEDINYKDTLTFLVKNPAEGVDYSELSKRIKVLDKLNEVSDNEILELEDEEYRVLVNIVKTAKWSVISAKLYKFILDITNVE